MIAVSDRFAAAMRTGTSTMVEQVEVIDPTDTPVGPPLLIVGGATAHSAGALIRHSTRLDIVDPTGDLTPRDLKDALHPASGARLRVWRGIDFGDGSDPELVPVITAHLQTGRARTGGEGRSMIPVAGLDGMSRCEVPSHRPLVIPGGTPVPEAVQWMLRTAYPGLGASLMTSRWTTPQLVYPLRTDLADEAAEVARWASARVYVDRLDGLVVAPRPMASNPPVWTFSQSDPTHIEAEVERDIDLVPNVVIVIGQHSSLDGPVHGVARVPRPGPDIVHEATTEKVLSPQQAVEAAWSELAAIQEGTEELRLRVAPAPVHVEVGDVVDADYPSIGCEGRYLVHALDVDHADPDAPGDVTLRKGVLFDAG